MILSLACDTILIISQEALFCYPHHFRLLYSPQHSWGIRLFIQKPYYKKGYALYEFHVRDNGIGISREFQEHLFESFTREETSTVSGIQGTGLGMAINVSHMVQEIAMELLSNAGFSVSLADDGDVAVETLRTAAPDQFDLVLMDIQMPKLDGYSATRQIRTLDSAIAKVLG